MDYIMEDQIITIFILCHTVDQKRTMPSHCFNSMEYINFFVLYDLFDSHICGTIDTDAGFSIPV